MNQLNQSAKDIFFNEAVITEANAFWGRISSKAYNDFVESSQGTNIPDTAGIIPLKRKELIKNTDLLEFILVKRLGQQFEVCELHPFDPKCDYKTRTEALKPYITEDANKPKDPTNSDYDEFFNSRPLTHDNVCGYYYIERGCGNISGYIAGNQKRLEQKIADCKSPYHPLARGYYHEEIEAIAIKNAIKQKMLLIPDYQTQLEKEAELRVESDSHLAFIQNNVSSFTSAALKAIEPMQVIKAVTGALSLKNF